MVAAGAPGPRAPGRQAARLGTMSQAAGEKVTATTDRRKIQTNPCGSWEFQVPVRLFQDVTAEETVVVAREV